MKAESWGMLLLVSAWPKDTPKIPWYKGMPSLQIRSFHSALHQWNCTGSGSERALQNFGGPGALQLLSNNYVKSNANHKITSFLPLLLVCCSDCPQSEWNVQGYRGCLVVGMATYIHVRMPGQSCNPEWAKPQTFSCFQGGVKATKHFCHICS